MFATDYKVILAAQGTSIEGVIDSKDNMLTISSEQKIKKKETTLNNNSHETRNGEIPTAQSVVHTDEVITNGNTNTANSSSSSSDAETRSNSLAAAINAEGATPMDTLSTCLVCGKEDRSVEFILPDRYCSQSCADKQGGVVCTASTSSSEFGDSVKSAKVKASGKAVNGHSSAHNIPGKRKKKKASYLSAYEENFRMDVIEDRKGSKPKKSKMFKYEDFFTEEGLQAAPQECFVREPSLKFVNLFSLGMKLEGIDPLHPTIYCVMTVKEIRGHRLRLHFDGYNDSHDFWTNASSDQIFPVGWCVENGKTLQPPKGMTKDSFSWDKYLLVSKATAAPRNRFTVCSKEFRDLKPELRVGDKLEAVDIKNHNLVCVATVSDTYGDKLLIHFDGWEEMYDYWCSYDSPCIHHVGWCQENLQVLSAPNGYPHPDKFTWESYTEETNSKPAPRDAFSPIKNLFEPGMVLEAVDRRNPALVRVAEVLEVADCRLLLHFCGWENKYDYWEDADSPDFHPVDWCYRTGHPLQPPLTPVLIVNYNGCCPTPGCYGYGHAKGAKYSGHHSLQGCPYSDINFNKDNIVVDRLIGQRNIEKNPSSSISPSATSLSQCETVGCNGTGHVTGKFPTHFTISGCPLAEVNQNKLIKNLSMDTNSSSVKKKRSRKPSGKTTRTKRSRKSTSDINFQENRIVARPASSVSAVTVRPPSASASHPSLNMPSTAIVKPHVNRSNTSLSKMMPPPPTKLSADDVLQDAVHNSVFLPALPVNHNGNKDLPVGWDTNVKLVLGRNNIDYSKVPDWSCQQVVDFVKTIVPQVTDEQKDRFIDQKIDGDSLLLFRQAELTSLLNLKLGPAIILYNAIRIINKVLSRRCN